MSLWKYTRLPSNGMEGEVRWKMPPLILLPIIICGAFLYGMDIFQLNRFSLTPARLQQTNDLTIQSSLKGFLIRTKGCRIPYLNPFDDLIRKYIELIKKPICNKGIPPLIGSNDTSIYLINSSLIYYEIDEDNIDGLQCCYRTFWHIKPKKKENDNKITFNNTCIMFTYSINIYDEFIKVSCILNNITIYKDFFSFVPIKQNKQQINNQDNKNNNKLNILIVGLDAVSRLNFHRQMPKTVNYLLKNNAIELLGFNKVADNTFPNLIPVLTGYDEKQLKKLCWLNDNKRFDNCPFIWKNYSYKGYLTSFSEDAAWMGMFNYQRRGFNQQPTDYYWGTFNQISEKEIGNSHKLNVYECVGSREVYKTFIDYMRKFTNKMALENQPYFGFFWSSSLTHDDLNKPKLGDETFSKFFQNLQDNDRLNNTILIVMSDHGIRWGSIRQTFQGRMEERLPFVFILLPDWYKILIGNAYNNLLKNTRRLTTHFDLHETLKDLLDPFNLTTVIEKKSRGYSLFSEIPPTRTCEDAGISSHWCTCQESYEISNNDTIVIQSAKFAVNFINFLLDGYAQCSVLTLDEISNARMMSYGDHIIKDNKSRDYLITFTTLPGKAIFETTVRATEARRTYQFEVMGTISRLNLYGKQSACVTDFHLKLYCYCRNLLV